MSKLASLRRRALNGSACDARLAGDPLHPLIGNAGVKARGIGEWPAREHGRTRRRVWRKVHLAVDESTLEVRAVEITGSGVGDAPVLADLLGQVAAGEEIASVTADCACDACTCRGAIARRGADAIIPSRRGAKPSEKDGPGTAPVRRAGPEAPRAAGRLGRTIWRTWTGYHRRSRAEARMSRMKLLGQKLMAVRHRHRIVVHRASNRWRHDGRLARRLAFDRQTASLQNSR